MPQKKPTAPTYTALVKTLRREIQEAQKEIERRTVLTYWTTGKHINAFLARVSRSEGYGERFYHKLGKDLSMDYRTLYQAAQFERTYPKLDTSLPLSWSHYRHLCHLKTDAERRKWEKRIIREGLSVKDLLALRSEAPPEKGGRLSARPGALYHYRAVKIGARFYLDAGFENYVDAPDGTTLDNTRVYRSDKREDGYALRLTKGVTKEDLYTYTAVVERVVDADTLLVLLDCGFGIRHRERLRLRGIDAPEKKTVAGRRATDFLKSQLPDDGTLIIKTHRPDKYGRYLADVFTDRAYLNNKLLEKGLAKAISRM